jgi:hypothetical protein
MKKKEVEREYNFSDAFLIQKCDDVIESVTRDQAEFTGRGFTLADRNAFQTKRDDFDALPTDEELESDVTAATEIKDDAAEALRVSAEALRVSVRTIRTAAENKWGTHKAKYRAYRFDGMDEMSDAQLVRLGKRVGRVATIQLPDLSPAIDLPRVTAHVALVNDLDVQIDNKESAVEDRDIATE